MKYKLSDIAYFNPRESIKRGCIAKKVAMDKLQPFCRDIPEYELKAFAGGTKFRNGDTIMARITPCLENGKIAKVNVLGKDEIGFGSTEYIVFRARPEVADEDYLYYLVCSPLVRESAIKSMVGSSGRQRVQTDVVQNLIIDVPDLATQKKIGSVLKMFDDRIALNNKINENLQQQAATLFESWFVNYEPWGGNQPSGWTNAPLGSFVEIKRGGSPRPIQNFLSDSGLRWLKISDVTSLSSPFVLEIKEHIKEEGLRKTVFLPAGELVLSNSATPGIPKILDVDTCIHDGWLYFPKSELSKYYLYLFFKHIRKELVSLGNGSVFTNLKTNILKAFPATKADETTLKEFDALVWPLFDAMLNADRENFKLAAMRDTLLPKLMSGEIDVSGIQL
nr:restriction endonuclease subunit S [uncultured Anaerostipes sp.]